MMLVMPVITPAASIVPSAQAGAADKGAPRFDETLRSESAALSRSDQRAAVHDSRHTQDEREASLRAAGRKQQEGESAEKSPAPIASSSGAAGENDFVAAGGSQRSEKNGAVKEDNLSLPVQVDQSQPLPTWLLAQPTALPFAAVEAGGEAAGNSGAQSFRMVATQISFVQAGVTQLSERAVENAGLGTPNQAAVASVVATNELPGAAEVSENIASLAAVAPESKIAQVRQPSVEVTDQIPLRPATVAEVAAPVNAGTLASDNALQASDSKVAALPISELLASLTPIVHEVTSRVAMASPMALGQALSPETLSQADSPVALGQAPSPQAASQANSPVLLSQTSGAAVISSTMQAERPVPAPGENVQVVDAVRTGDPGLQATVVAGPASADSPSDQRQFADFDRPTAPQVEEAPRPADSGRTEFSNLLTGSDQAGASGSLRASGSAQVIPAVTSTPAMDGRIVEQVVGRVKLSGASGETSLSLTLHPKELGEVRVELVAGKDGLRAHLHSQTQMVQEVLERHLPRLREAFEAQGVKLSDLQVSCDGRRDGGNAASQQREQGQWPQSRYQIADSRAGAGASPEWAGGPGASNSGWSSAPGFSLRV